MKTPIAIIIVVFLLSIVLPMVSSEEKFSENYNEKMIKEFVEEDASMGWNIHFFEKKFGSKAAIVYLSILIFIAMFIKKYVW